MTHLNIRRTVATMTALGIAGVASWALPVAAAHDVVIGGNPADGETLTSFPDSVLLEFSGEPRDGFNTLAISDMDTDEVLYTGEPEVVGRDVSLDLPSDLDPGPGTYRIGFQITSSDGHSTRGFTSFTVAGEGEGAASASTSEASEEAASEGLSTGAKVGLAIAAVLVVVAVAVVALGRNKRRDELDS